MKKRALSLLLALLMAVSLVSPAYAETGDETPASEQEGLLEDAGPAPEEYSSESSGTQSSDEALEEEEPSGEGAEEPGEEPVEEPTEVPTEEPVETPVEDPVEEPGEEPAEERSYTLTLNHILEAGARQYATLNDVVTVTEADIADGVYDAAKNAFVKEGLALMAGDYSVTLEALEAGTARLTLYYEIAEGYVLVPKNDGVGTFSRYEGEIPDVEVVPVEIITLTIAYWYWAGHLEDVDNYRMSAPETVQIEPDRDANGNFLTTYTLDWTLPVEAGFSPILDTEYIDDIENLDPEAPDYEETLAQYWAYCQQTTLGGVAFQYDPDTNVLHAEGLTKDWADNLTYTDPRTGEETQGTVVLVWYRRELTGYTVEHMLQDIDADGNILDSYTTPLTMAADGSLLIDGSGEPVVQHFADRANELTKAVARDDVPGYAPKAFTQVPISADGDTVVTIRYDVIPYVVKFDTGAGSYVDNAKIAIGSRLRLDSGIYDRHPERTGYLFSHWELEINYYVYDGNGQIVYDENGNPQIDHTEVVEYHPTWDNGDLSADQTPDYFVLDEKTQEAAVYNEELDQWEITLTAVWVADTQEYQVNFWVQNPDDDEYTERGSAYVMLPVGTDVANGLIDDLDGPLWADLGDGAENITVTRHMEDGSIPEYKGLLEVFESFYGTVNTADPVNESVFFHVALDEDETPKYDVLTEGRDEDGNVTQETGSTVMDAKGEAVINVYFDRNVYTVDFVYSRAVKAYNGDLILKKKNNGTEYVLDSIEGIYISGIGYIPLDFYVKLPGSDETIHIDDIDDFYDNYDVVPANDGDTDVLYQIYTNGNMGDNILAQTLFLGLDDIDLWYIVKDSTQLPQDYSISARYGQSLEGQIGDSGKTWGKLGMSVTAESTPGTYAEDSSEGPIEVYADSWAVLYGEIRDNFKQLVDDGVLFPSEASGAHLGGRHAVLSADLVADPKDTEKANVLVGHWRTEYAHLNYVYHAYFDVGWIDDTNEDGVWDAGETAHWYSDEYGKLYTPYAVLNPDGSFADVRTYRSQKIGIDNEPMFDESGEPVMETKIYVRAYDTTGRVTGLFNEQLPTQYNHFTAKNPYGNVDITEDLDFAYTIRIIYELLTKRATATDEGSWACWDEARERYAYDATVSLRDLFGDVDGSVNFEMPPSDVLKEMVTNYAIEQAIASWQNKEGMAIAAPSKEEFLAAVGAEKPENAGAGATYIKSTIGLANLVLDSSTSDIYYYYDREFYEVSYYVGNNLKGAVYDSDGNVTGYDDDAIRRVPYNTYLDGATFNYPQGQEDNPYSGKTAGAKPWVFHGWSTDAFGYTPVDWASETNGKWSGYIIQNDVDLYAAWESPSYYLYVDFNGGADTSSSWRALPDSTRYSGLKYQLFEEGDVINEVGVIPHPSYTTRDPETGAVVYYTLTWYLAQMNADGTPVIVDGHFVPGDTSFDFSTRDMMDDYYVVAVWTPGTAALSYRVHYVIAGTEGAEGDTTGFGIPVAPSVTRRGYMLGDTVYERAVQTSGEYDAQGYAPDAATKSLALELDEYGNLQEYNIVFYYSLAADRDYIVQFKDMDTGEIVYTSIDDQGTGDGDTVKSTNVEQLTVYPHQADVDMLDSLWYNLVLVNSRTGEVVTDEYGIPIFVEDVSLIGQTKRLAETNGLDEVPESNIFTFLVKRIFALSYLDALDDTIYSGEANGFIGAYKPDELPVLINAARPTKEHESITYTFAGWTIGPKTKASASGATNEFVGDVQLSLNINIEEGSVGNLIFVAQWYGLETVKEITSEIPEGGYQIGDTISYKITVTNRGSLDIPEDIEIIDELEGAELSSNVLEGGLKVGESKSVTATYVVTAEDAGNGSVVNTARAETTMQLLQGDGTMAKIAAGDVCAVEAPVDMNSVPPVVPTPTPTPETPTPTPSPETPSPSPTTTPSPTPAPGDGPHTGDESNMVLWTGLVLISMVGMTPLWIMLAKKKKENAQ